LVWLESYLLGRCYAVHCAGKCLLICKTICSVPQGSVSCSLSTLYTADLEHIAAKHGVDFHSYADDNRLNVNFHGDNGTDAMVSVAKLEACVTGVSE
jgi:hypothetical protein